MIRSIIYQFIGSCKEFCDVEIRSVQPIKKYIITSTFNIAALQKHLQCVAPLASQSFFAPAMRALR